MEKAILALVVIAIILSAGTMFYVVTFSATLGDMSGDVGKLVDTVEDISKAEAELASEMANLASELGTSLEKIEDIESALSSVTKDIEDLKTRPTPTATVSPEMETLIIGTTDTLRWLASESIVSAVDLGIGVQIYDRLLRHNPKTGEIEPELATSYDISADGLVYTFHLRDNVYFHDGVKFTASAVKRTWEDAWSGEWYTLSTIAGDKIESVEVVDDLTLKVTLKAPFGPALALIAMPNLTVNSPEHHDREKDEYVGTGPYKFVHWIREEEVKLERNEDYWKTSEKPKLKYLIWKFFGSASSLAMALKLGTVDLAWRTVPISELQAFMNDPNYEVIEQAPARISNIYMNRRFDEFNQEKIRQAVSYCIDRDEIIEKAYKGILMKEAYSCVPPDFPGYYPAFEHFYGAEPDYDKAKQLLAEAGFPDGVTLEYVVGDGKHWGPEPIDAVTLIKSQLEKGGFTVNLELQEYAAAHQTRREGKLMMSGGAGGWIFDYFDAYHYLDNWIRAGWGKRSAVDEPEAEALLELAAATTDPVARNEVYKQIQEFYAENVPMVPLGVIFQHAIVNKDKVKGFEIANPFFDTYFFNVEKIG
jgi:peptide/nickel transport system substrate-binding protein